MIIRPASGEDLPRLAALFRQEITYQRQISPFLDFSPHFDYLRFLQAKLRNPHERLFVAERNAQLLGYIVVRVIQAPNHRFPRNILRHFFSENSTPAFVRAPNTGCIEDCYVEPQSRRQRVGSALLKEGLGWFGAQGVRRIELAVFAGNGDGIAFWEKQGFVSSRFLMTKEIG
jgi:ribosomal protein S18 acetylase RimI-like enzyme